MHMEETNIEDSPVNDNGHFAQTRYIVLFILSIILKNTNCRHFVMLMFDCMHPYTACCGLGIGENKGHVLYCSDLFYPSRIMSSRSSFVLYSNLQNYPTHTVPYIGALSDTGCVREHPNIRLGVWGVSL